MTDKELVLALAKVMIAAAWIDGSISKTEYESLKQWLSPLQISAHEWARLEMYLGSPVGEAERGRLVQDLASRLVREDDKQQIHEALQDVIKADGTVTTTEATAITEMLQAIDQADVTVLGRLGRLVQQAIHQRQTAAATIPNREAQFDEFVHNRVYYRVCERLAQKELNLSEANLRKLSLAGGLLARVAHVDQHIAPEEQTAMVNVLQQNWQVDHAAATFVTEVALSEIQEGLDYYELIAGFNAVTNESERTTFLDALFAIANADRGLFHEESEQIRRIARGLDLTREQFMAARQKIHA
ncbi:MAG: TerB family tellurite resistance protein [Candidatus Promineifilaceae bacterium]